MGEPLRQRADEAVWMLLCKQQAAENNQRNIARGVPERYKAVGGTEGIVRNPTAERRAPLGGARPRSPRRRPIRTRARGSSSTARASEPEPPLTPPGSSGLTGAVAAA
jgi:hypothetical protein